jgi:hypothetical protein
MEGVLLSARWRFYGHPKLILGHPNRILGHPTRRLGGLGALARATLIKSWRSSEKCSTHRLSSDVPVGVEFERTRDVSQNS